MHTYLFISRLLARIILATFLCSAGFGQDIDIPADISQDQGQIGLDVKTDGSDWIVEPKDWSTTEFRRIEVGTNIVTGKPEQVLRSYTLVVNGLNYLTAERKWAPSVDAIDLLPKGGATAVRGPLKVNFPATLGTDEPLTIISASNTVIRVKPAGVYFTDYDSGKSVLVGSITQSEGELLPPNRVIYRGAIREGLKADMVYTYTKGGFEADLCIIERPQQSPESLGLNPETTRLELVNIIDGTTPNRNGQVIKPDNDPERRARIGANADLVDETLDFGGDLCFRQGRAFSAPGSDSPDMADTNAPAPIHGLSLEKQDGALPVAKTWATFDDNQQGLIEAVPWTDIKPMLDNLPPVGRQGANRSSEMHASSKRSLPTFAKASVKEAKPMLIASSGYKTPGVVLDYWTPTGNGPFSFTNSANITNRTYVITNSLSILYGATFDGGAVIKFTSVGQITLGGGTIVCNGSSNTPTVLTSDNDDSPSSGQILPWSTHSPVSSAYPRGIILNGPSTPQTLTGFKVLYAKGGFQIFGGGSPSHTVSSCAFAESPDCQFAVYASGCQVNLVSSTICHIGTPTAGSGTFSGSLTDICCTAPSISAQPQAVTTCQSNNVTFTVSASGSASLNYQWRFQGANISGATSSSYTTNNVQSSNAGNYSVVVTNSCGSLTSSNALLTVNVPPSITSQPQATTVCQSYTAIFNVTATGSPLYYQWRFQGANISGATSSSYTNNNVQPSNAGNYSVVVSNSCSTVTSASAYLTVNALPSITSQPQSTSTCLGSSATFSVGATGAASYQWRYNGVNIPGANASSFTTNNVQTNSVGPYSVAVNNACGSMISANANLTINTSPNITMQPVGQSVSQGSSANFNVAANGATGYQWYKNSTPISGQTSSSLTIPNAQPPDAGLYKVYVSNGCGGLYSTEVSLTVTAGSLSFSPNGHDPVSYATNALQVTCTSVAGSTIHYKIGTSGSWQTVATGTPFTVNGIDNGWGTIQAYATIGSSVVSTTNTSGEFVFRTPEPTTTTTGNGSSVTITATAPGATIYYTTDESTPTTSSTIYSSPRTNTVSGIYAFIAVLPGYLPSSCILAVANRLNTPTITTASGVLSGNTTVNNSLDVWVYPCVSAAANNYFEYGNTTSWWIGTVAMTGDTPNSNIQLSALDTTVNDAGYHLGGVHYSMGHTYSGGIWLKSPNNNHAYAGLLNEDSQMRLIDPGSVNEPSGWGYVPTVTWNTQTIYDGATTVYVANATAFAPVPVPEVWYSDIFQPLTNFNRYTPFLGKNQPNALMDIEVYDGEQWNAGLATWVRAVDTNLNTVTLANPYHGPTLPVGTALQRRCANGWYQYFIANWVPVSTTWTYYSSTFNAIRSGTDFFNELVLLNYDTNANTLFTGFEIWEGVISNRPQSYISVDGSDPFSKTPVTGPIKMTLDGNNQGNLQASQKGTYYINSPIAQRSITFQVGLPTVGYSWSGGCSSVTITGATVTAGAVLRYTLDGSTPTSGSPTLPATLSAGSVPPNCTLTVAGFKGNYNNSANATTTIVSTTTPTITTQPTSQTLPTGSNVSFSVAATGGGISYQWKFNGANIVGATTSSYSKAGIQATDTGTYSVLISNCANSVLSQGAVLTITGPDGDGDGMADIWETTYFGGTSRNGTGDYDSDGVSDLQEYQQGLNPTTQDSEGDNVIDQPFKVSISRPSVGSTTP